MAQTMFGAVTSALAARERGLAAEDARQEEFDYVIVGAGSAGCVIAHRLSAHKGVSVLLLEAGGPDNDPLIHDFARFPELQGSKFDWKYQTEPEPHLNGRRIDWPRGKVLGGSSSINAMIYIRGHKLDYDHWNYLGNEGWSYKDILPLFKKSERNETFHDRFHGADGPLNVAESPIRNALGPAFIEAAHEIGLRAEPTWDFNGEIQEGVAGYYQHTVKGGIRHSAATAFLTPVLTERPNLDVRPWSFVTRVLVDGVRAEGVEYISMDGKMHRIHAKREVVVSAGAIDSPQLLMLSGIGPADHLRQHDIDVVMDLPGVGRNLQDHPFVLHEFASKIPAEGTVPCGGLFLRSRDLLESSSPDLQYHPYSYSEDGHARFDFAPTLVRPQSLGRILLKSPDPRAAPRIHAQYLESQRDLRALHEGVKISREFGKSKAMARLLGEELPPFRDATSDREVQNAIRQTASTLYHPVGTCRMGHDESAVVDPQLRVHGIEGLRVADASIMPVIVNGNTNAPCIMIGEKAAAMISRS